MSLLILHEHVGIRAVTMSVILLLFLGCSVSVWCGVQPGQYSVVWVDNDALWRTEYPSGVRTKLYGDKAFFSFSENGCLMTSVPNLTTVAVEGLGTVTLFDASHPGFHRSMLRVLSQKPYYGWTGELAIDGNGILVEKIIGKNLTAMYGGLYMARPDGRITKIAKPRKSDLDGGVRACYSPDRSRLVIYGPSFFQIMDARTGRTLIYAKDWRVRNAVWLDNHRMVASHGDSLWLVADSGKKVPATPWLLLGFPTNWGVSNMVYAVSAGDLYLLVRTDYPPQKMHTPPVLYHVRPDKKSCERVALPFPNGISSLLSVSDDGRLLLVTTPTAKGPAWSDSGELWIMDMKTGKPTLISALANNGLFLHAKSVR